MAPQRKSNKTFKSSTKKSSTKKTTSLSKKSTATKTSTIKSDSKKDALLKSYQYTPPIQLPFIIVNLQTHFERTFDLWNIKNPSLKVKIYRTSIFIGAMLCTIYWPIQDLVTNGIITILTWILLSLWSFKIPRFLLMLNLMLSISFLYYMMKLIIPVRSY